MIFSPCFWSRGLKLRSPVGRIFLSSNSVGFDPLHFNRRKIQSVCHTIFPRYYYRTHRRKLLVASSAGGLDQNLTSVDAKERTELLFFSEYSGFRARAKAWPRMHKVNICGLSGQEVFLSQSWYRESMVSPSNCVC